MSILLGIRYKTGTIFTADAFVFDNNNDYPLKDWAFNRFYISPDKKLVMMAVGSRAVYFQFTDWHQANYEKAQEIQIISNKWSELQQKWEEKRKQLIKDENVKTLRPLSDSLLVIHSVNKPEHIISVKTNGEINYANRYVIAGTGSALVREIINELKAPELLDRKDAVEAIIKSYRIAKHNLYVSGNLSFLSIDGETINDQSENCFYAWKNEEDLYYENLKILFQKK